MVAHVILQLVLISNKNLVAISIRYQLTEEYKPDAKTVHFLLALSRTNLVITVTTYEGGILFLEKLVLPSRNTNYFFFRIIQTYVLWAKTESFPSKNVFLT